MQESEGTSVGSQLAATVARSASSDAQLPWRLGRRDCVRWRWRLTLARNVNVLGPRSKCPRDRIDTWTIIDGGFCLSTKSRR